MTQQSRMEDWDREWVGKPRDLELIEERDLQPLVQSNCAWMVKDTRRLRMALSETLYDQEVPVSLYCREYLVFLQSGIWWRVPAVRVRLIYDRRGVGVGKVRMALRDFQALYAVYFPDGRSTPQVVDGLEAHVHRVVV